MKLFLAGIMQGSHLGVVLHSQDYRARLKELLARHWPAAQVYDPFADHGNSLEYDDDHGRRVFLHHVAMCREIDCVLAFLPEASMGTAIEVWEAHTHGRVVVSISPLRHNWVVRFMSDLVYGDVADFEEALREGLLARRIAEVAAEKRAAGGGPKG